MAHETAEIQVQVPVPQHGHLQTLIYVVSDGILIGQGGPFCASGTTVGIRVAIGASLLEAVGEVVRGVAAGV